MRFAICNLLVAVAMLGCDDRKTVEPPKKVVETPGRASVRGKVTFGGIVKTPPPIDNSICRHAEPIVDETVLVDGAGGLANVIVSVSGVRSGGPASADAVVLDQKDCRFTPRIVAVRAGQPVRIRNSDPEAHNVHGNPGSNPAFNVGLATAGGSKDVAFAAAEIFRVKCDVHPWMTAYVGVFDSDYFAVTNTGGEFEMKGLPAGSYELVAWHERFGELKQTITVRDGSNEANFAYEPPK